MRLRIFGTVWTIEEVVQKEMNERFGSGEDDKELDGFCDYDNQKIYIAKELHPHRKSVALTHELLHALYDYSGLFLDSAIEEGQIRATEHPLFELIKVFPEKYK